MTLRSISRLFGAALVILIALLSLVGAFRTSGHSTAAREDTLVVVMPTFAEETFLPWLGSSGRTFYMNAIYEFLVYVDPATLTLKPGLAERWEVSPDGREIRFWLRHGVQFQNGYGELTSEDVRYSIERLIEPSSRSGPATLMRAAIESVEVPDRYTVVLRLKTPDIDFIKSYLSDAAQATLIVSSKYVRQKGDSDASAAPIGTGPYALADHRRGSFIELKAVAGHWRVHPQFDRIVFRAVPEESTRVAMLLAGEADLAPVNYESIDTIKARAGLHTISIKDAWAPVIRMGGLGRFPDGKNPWAKKEVRQALNYAIDKNTIVKALFHGEARSVGSSNPTFSTNVPPAYPYDPAKAKQLLAKAGYPNGFSMTMQTFPLNPGANMPSVGEAVAQYWQQIGVRAEVVPTEYASNRAAVIAGKTAGTVWVHRGNFSISPVFSLQLNNSTKSSLAAFANADTDQMLSQIGAELDADKRQDLIQKMNFYTREQASDIFIGWANEVYGASKKVGYWPAVPGFVTNIDLIMTRKQ